MFGDYYAFDIGAEKNGVAIMKRSRDLCEVGMHRMRISHDPAGDAKTAMGGTVRGEFERAGLRGVHGLESWGQAKKQEGLQLVEALLRSADNYVSLTIDPRCKLLMTAMTSYVRAKRGNQWMDYPADPLHPHEELIDPLCGALKLEFPKAAHPSQTSVPFPPVAYDPLHVVRRRPMVRDRHPARSVVPSSSVDGCRCHGTGVSLTARIDPAYLDGLLARITPFEAWVVRQRHGLTDNRRERTAEEVGEDCGLPAWRIVEIEGRAILKMLAMAETLSAHSTDGPTTSAHVNVNSRPTVKSSISSMHPPLPGAALWA